MLTQHLANAFNDCADKIVNAAELMRLSFAEYARALSPDEHALVVSLKSQRDEAIGIETKSILSDSAKRQKLVETIGDGTIGLYACADNQMFVSARFVKFMEESLRDKMNRHFSPELLKKLDSADANALLKATDHREKAASLKLRALV